MAKMDVPELPVLSAKFKMATSDLHVYASAKIAASELPMLSAMSKVTQGVLPSFNKMPTPDFHMPWSPWHSYSLLALPWCYPTLPTPPWCSSAPPWCCPVPSWCSPSLQTLTWLPDLPHFPVLFLLGSKFLPLTCLLGASGSHSLVGGLCDDHQLEFLVLHQRTLSISTVILNYISHNPLPNLIKLNHSHL